MKSRIVEMQLTPVLLPQLTELFEMEIEILQGEKKELENGLTFIKVTLSGHKLEIFEDFCKMLMSLATDKIKVTYRGLIVSPN